MILLTQSGDLRDSRDRVSGEITVSRQLPSFTIQEHHAIFGPQPDGMSGCAAGERGRFSFYQAEKRYIDDVARIERLLAKRGTILGQIRVDIVRRIINAELGRDLFRCVIDDDSIRSRGDPLRPVEAIEVAGDNREEISWRSSADRVNAAGRRAAGGIKRLDRQTIKARETAGGPDDYRVGDGPERDDCVRWQTGAGREGLPVFSIKSNQTRRSTDH